MGESSLDKNVQMTIPYLDIYVNIKKKYICVWYNDIFQNMRFDLIVIHIKKMFNDR